MAYLLIYFSGFKFKKRTIQTNHPCMFIDSITQENETINIQFNENIQNYNPIKLSSFFGYFTSIFNQPLLMPPGSAYKAIITNSTLSISFSIPFISDFSGIFFCADTNTYEIPPFQLPIFNKAGILYEKDLNISVPNFRNDFDDTQILCHGSSSEDRWCEALDIGMAHGKLVMQTKAHFEFPSSFLSLCGRSPPFDNLSQKIRYEPLLTKRNIAEISIGHVANDEIAVLASPCCNRAKIFDVIFDFLIPAHQTLQKSVILKNSKEGRKVRFFFRDSGDQRNIELIKSITKEIPSSLPNFDQLLIFDRVILGIEKADEDCDGTRSIFARYGHIYKYNQENTKGFRETVLDHFGIKYSDTNDNQNDEKPSKEEEDKKNIEKNDENDDLFDEYNKNDEDDELNFDFNEDEENEESNDKKPNNNKKKALVTFFDTSKQKIDLKIINIEPLKRFILRSCPFCDVKIADVDTPNISSLLEIASASSVIIARSGIGLEHAVWLKNNSHVIELRPFGFWCDDKYEIAANISGSHYYSVMNTKQITIEFEDNLVGKNFNNCFSAPSYCESQDCYQTLLNQRVDIELSTFNQTWYKIQLDLQKKFASD